jgi:hypothetical protein
LEAQPWPGEVDHGDNETDSDGITEGDPRNPTAPNGRVIFGRSVVLSVGYDF